MNNSQFRTLGTVEKQPHSSSKTQNDQSFKKPTLGSKSRSSIPMTPRSLGGYASRDSFSKQVTELQRNGNDEPPAKRFKASSAPKGTKLAPGFIDRTKTYNDDSVEANVDPKVKRLKALEEMLKLQQINQDTFENLRNEIGIGGDLTSTHLVKGLDRKLLERIRAGEDVTKLQDPNSHNPQGDKDSVEDLEDELEKVLEKNVSPRKNTEKGSSKLKDQDTEPHTQTMQSLSRDEILRRLKDNRSHPQHADKATSTSRTLTEVPAPVLGDRFKSISNRDKPNKKKYTEVINGRRREVLEITDKETGKVKRKTKWLDPETRSNDSNRGEVMGMDLPEEILAMQRVLEQQQREAEAADDDADIFADVGEYDPLAGIDSEDDNNAAQDTKDQPQQATSSLTSTSKPPEPRNYFNVSSKDQEGVDSSATPSMAQDASIMAAIKRAAAIRQRQEATRQAGETVEDDDDVDQETLNKRRAFLDKLKERDRQDAMDMDMGFGESRFDEEQEEGEANGKLAEWKDSFGYGDDDEEDPDNRGKKAAGAGRKRKPKKRKGDKNSFNDVMSVLEGRKKTS